jgi:hypothetical protein
MPRLPVVEVASEQNIWQRAAPVQLWSIEYSKGSELPPDSPLRTDPVRRAVAQKLPEYSYQHEYRLVLLSYGDLQTDAAPPNPSDAIDSERCKHSSNIPPAQAKQNESRALKPTERAMNLSHRAVGTKNDSEVGQGTTVKIYLPRPIPSRSPGGRCMVQPCVLDRQAYGATSALPGRC